MQIRRGGLAVAIAFGGAFGALTAGAAAQLPPLVVEINEPTPLLGGAFGRVVAVGDVNGDGFDDLCAAAPASIHPLGGEAFVFWGPGLSAVVPLAEPVPENGAEFGWSIAAGDVNGDGSTDVIVGAPNATAAGLTQAGEAFVFLGPTLSTVVSLSQPTPEVSASFGWSVASGDVNGDGNADVIVGATGAGGFPFGGGAVYVYLGPGLTTVLTITEPTPEPGAWFGTAVASGDVNGDGFADVVVGADRANPGGVSDAGEAFVFYGPALTTVTSLTEPAPEFVASFGWRVAAGDVDGDGLDEVVVAALGSPGGVRSAGEVFVFSGAGLGTVTTLVEPTPEMSASFGASLAVEDLDGDGSAEVVAGATVATAGGLAAAGEVFAFAGPGLTSVTQYFQPAPQQSASFGHDLAIGDVNGDGVCDLMVGAIQQTVGGAIFAGATFAFVTQSDFAVDTLVVSASTGGPVGFALSAGAARASDVFVVVGSASGTSPCLPFGSVCVPLVPDPFTVLFLNPPLVGGLSGVLNASGDGSASITFPAGIPAGLVGFRFYWAYTLFSGVLPASYASSPVVFEIVN